MNQLIFFSEQTWIHVGVPEFHTVCAIFQEFDVSSVLVLYARKYVNNIYKAYCT